MGSVCGCHKEQPGRGQPQLLAEVDISGPQHPRYALRAPLATPREDATPVLAQCPPLACKLEGQHLPRDRATPGRGLAQRRN